MATLQTDESTTRLLVLEVPVDTVAAPPGSRCEQAASAKPTCLPPQAPPPPADTRRLCSTTLQWRAVMVAASLVAAALVALGVLCGVRPGSLSAVKHTTAAGVQTSIMGTGPYYKCPSQSADRDLTFFVIGDWGRWGNGNQQSALRVMEDVSTCMQPNFIISVGDNFYPSGLKSASDPALHESFSSVYSKQSLQVTWYSVLGNHDYGDGHSDWRSCPKAKSLGQCGGCCISPLWQVSGMNHNLEGRWRLRQGAWIQSFMGGQVDILFLDTNPFISSYHKQSWADVTGGIAFQDASAQQREAESLLASSRARWKLVVGHHPVFSFGEHCGGGRRNRMDHCGYMQWLRPLMDRYRVTAYFSGHDHDLQYIKPSDDWVHYVVSGAGSDIRYGEFHGADTSRLAQHYFADDKGFVAVTIKGQVMTLYFYTSSYQYPSYTVTFGPRG